MGHQALWVSLFVSVLAYFYNGKAFSRFIGGGVHSTEIEAVIAEREERPVQKGPERKGGRMERRAQVEVG